MNTYFVLLLAVGINISVIAGSLIFFLWIADRYYDNSFEYKAAKIAVIWVDCLLSLITSAIVFKIIVQDLQDHPLLTTTLFIPIIVAISLYAVKHRGPSQRQRQTRHLPIGRTLADIGEYAIICV